MSSCLTGASRAYRLDLELIKSPSNSWISHSSSPSSTLSESSNSPLAIVTRKPRTPRKRPNQTYNEAAAILSTAYPKIFPTKHLTKTGKFTKPHSHSSFPYESPHDLLLPLEIQNPDFLLHPTIREKPNISNESKGVNSREKICQSPGEINSKEEFCNEFQDDFDAESILDEEIEEGIDSVIGKFITNDDTLEDNNDSSCYNNRIVDTNPCYGYPVWLGQGNYFDFGFGMRREAFRNVNDHDWWRFPSVNVQDITPKFNKTVEKKKKKKVEKIVELKNLDTAKEKSAVIKTITEDSVQKTPKEEAITKPLESLLLKINYDDVLNVWSDRSSPFPDEFQGSEASGSDVQARLAKIDLFTESGGLREASVMRYKEKRRTRLFSKKIRYQVRKVNADQRPRMKGRFVRRPDSPDNEQG